MSGFSAIPAMLFRVRRRILRIQSHLVFGADCAAPLAVTWLDSENPIRFTQHAPLPPAVQRELEQLLPGSQPYLKAVKKGEAEGLLVCVDGKIVHSAFLMFRNKTTCLLGFDRTTGLLGNSFTTPAYRGRGCQARSTRARIAMAAQAGLSRVISETAPDNHASQRGLTKGGMSLIGATRFFVVFNTLVVRTELASPEVPGSVHASEQRLSLLQLCWAIYQMLLNAAG